MEPAFNPEEYEKLRWEARNAATRLQEDDDTIHRIERELEPDAEREARIAAIHARMKSTRANLKEARDKLASLEPARQKYDDELERGWTALTIVLSLVICIVVCLLRYS